MAKEESGWSRCGNCDEFVSDDELVVPIPNLEQRLDPGGVVPTGECPSCGALCYIFEEPSDQQFMEAARREYHRDGECEIDISEETVVSRGGDAGAYVQAWVWVSFHDIQPLEEKTVSDPVSVKP